MACYTITTVSLDLKNVDVDKFRITLEGMGYTVNLAKDGQSLTFSHKTDYYNRGSWDRKTGQLTVRDEKTGVKIRKTYVGLLAKTRAKKYGWTVQNEEETL